MDSKLVKWFTCACAALAFAASGWAQTPDPPARFFKLTFVVKEVEFERVVNSKTYTAIVSTEKSNNPGCSIRSGSKVAIPTSASSTANTFVDIGVNLDCSSIREVDDQLALRVISEVSSIPEDSVTKGYHLIRQNRWNSMVLVPLNRPTTIFSSEDLMTNKRQIELELTAIPVRPGAPIR